MLRAWRVGHNGDTPAVGTPPVRSPAVPARIELRDVSKTFGELRALAPVDFDVADGETVTLLGPSGCGKTTLLRLIAGLETPSTGTIAVNGLAPADARRRKQIGFIPQAPALLPWRTVEGNARLLLDINRRNSPSTPHLSVVELLDEVGLGDFRDAYPHELSGGMQQRVGLVRAFALDAPILLMDEPFAALDEMTRTDMRHLLGRLREPLGTTVVFVTHSIPEATFLSDRVAVMSARPGRVTDDITVDLAHPRLPDLEDTDEFFHVTTRLRSALRDGSSS
jgi:NitT/TauT family transport system ATP-binding protein